MWASRFPGCALALLVAASSAACSNGDAKPRGSGLPGLCSGCPSEKRTDDLVHFHHVHLNTTDAPRAVEYFSHLFGTHQVRLNDRADVIKADGALLLLNQVDTPPPSTLVCGIEHMGWGTVDVSSWFQDAVAKGAELDPGGPAAPAQLYPSFWFVYLKGPESERIEVNTFRDSEFSHVHFMTDDVDKTVAFYESLLGISPSFPSARTNTLFSSNTIVVDHINMIFFGPPYPVPNPFEKMDDHPIGHVAFAVPNLDQYFAKAKSLGAEVVSEPGLSAEYGFRSAFVRGPNLVLIELVEAGAIPNALVDAGTIPVRPVEAGADADARP